MITKGFVVLGTGPHYASLASLELTEIHLPLPPDTGFEGVYIMSCLAQVLKELCFGRGPTSLLYLGGQKSQK